MDLKYDSLKKYFGDKKIIVNKNLNSKSIKKLMDDTAKHFKTDKWDLNLSILVSETIQALTGIDPLHLLFAELDKRGIKIDIVYKPEVGNVIRLNKKRSKKKLAKKTKKKNAIKK